ncbi:thioredoxin-like protein [Thamnocephalis sphaerospora]|uniref:Thioredoxin-like protein n=1 Tax=Thamnocephalis sphaerospora TaxID=78915 RepID=A0A4P9XSA0_9FUNG|nr:thioredoxin-like protein [Thamnocephalis sphaerospora]|eukprot:RKP08997.1 thioredoxin-like protein [Thamnocephalis sphaerospora]
MQHQRMPRVEFCYDIACPWAYVASRRVEALAARTNAELVWKPVLLSALLESPAVPAASKGARLKQAVRDRDLKLAVERHAVPFRRHPRHPLRTEAALRLIWSVPESHRAVLSCAIFRAYWVENLDVDRVSVLLLVARSIGLKEVNEAMLQDPEARRQLHDATQTCIDRGAPGVPNFWIAGSDDGKGELYWGQDQLHFVEAQLLSFQYGGEWRAVPNLLSLQHRLRPGRPSQHATTLRFWFDFGSYWSFLGWQQVERILAEAGPKCLLEPKPLLLGPLFREISDGTSPIMGLPPRSQKYMWENGRTWQRWINITTGKNTSTIWPSNFPLRTVTALRVAILEPRTITPIFEAAWLKDVDIGDSEQLVKVLNAAGFDGAALLRDASINRNGCKEQLSQHYSEAISLGIFGAPTFQVNNGHIIFGQDRLDVVQDMLAGWRSSLIPLADGERPVHRIAFM